MSKNMKTLFTPAQIFEELQRQNVVSLKGIDGANLLYQIVIDYHRKGTKSIPPRIFHDCGIPILKLHISEIAIGQFFLRKNILNNFVISINEVVQDYYSKGKKKT